MAEKQLYTKEDCVETGYGCPIQGTVVVLDQKPELPGQKNQLF